MATKRHAPHVHNNIQKKKFKFKYKSNTMQPSIKLRTHNRYADLTDNESEIDPAIIAPITKTKIPPIVTINMKYTNIKTLMSTINITEYSLKYISMGIKIFCNSLEDHKKTIEYLKTTNTEFFTHDIPSAKTTKFVLSGLPEMPIDDIKNELTASNIPFIDIKKMHTKNDHNDYALYLVYFSNKSIKLNELKQIKYLLNVVITWNPYIPSKRGPTQCNNCQLHGHGSKNCHLPSRCSKCAGKHTTSDCQQTEQNNYKCCLCGNSHTSKDQNCPKRINYIKMQLNRSTKNSQNITKTIEQPKNFQLNTKNFPSLPVRKEQKFSSWLSGLNPQPKQTNNDLFSTQELLELTTELITNLQNCRTKMDQFQVITQLAIKYINYD